MCKCMFILAFITLIFMAGIFFFRLHSSTKKATDISPAEDLMYEHGILERVLLVYEECIKHIEHLTPASLHVMHDAAEIVRTFIEEYHEKQEEDYIFNRFEQTEKMVELVGILRAQHEEGRTLTKQILRLTETQNAPDFIKLKQLVHSFIYLYRAHMSRENTELFRAIPSVMTTAEYDALGDIFESNEHQLFGHKGYEKMLERVETLERKLGINSLSYYSSHS